MIPIRLLLIIAGITASAGGAGGVAYYAHHKQQAKQEEVTVKEEKAELPADFFNTVPKPAPKPEPKIQPVQKVEEKPAPRQEDYIRPLPVVAYDKGSLLKTELVQLAEKRRRSDSITGTNYLDTKTSTPSVVYPPSEDKDFSANDAPRSDATYPVNMDRVIGLEKIIPAVLESTIKSELPGDEVRARVQKDIVGSTGRTILIAKGSVLIGRYKPLKKSGDTRLQITWYRIRTAIGDGSRIMDVRLQGQVLDAEGSSGITGEVDDRFKEKYGAALLISTINAGSQLGAITSNNYQAVVTANAFSTPLSQVTQQLMQQSFQLEPRVLVAHGTEINIAPLTDIWFKEPKGLSGVATELPEHFEAVGDSAPQTAKLSQVK